MPGAVTFNLASLPNEKNIPAQQTLPEAEPDARPEVQEDTQSPKA